MHFLSNVTFYSAKTISSIFVRFVHSINMAIFLTSHIILHIRKSAITYKQILATGTLLNSWFIKPLEVTKFLFTRRSKLIQIVTQWWFNGHVRGANGQFIFHFPFQLYCIMCQKTHSYFLTVYARLFIF